jgi:ribosomal protein S11
MARSEITVAELTAYNTAASVTADAVDTSNNHFVDITDLKDEKLLIRLYGGTGDGFTAAFKAGDYPAGGIGDLSVAVAAAATKIICVESGRFKDDDEYILIDASSTGTATAATIEVFSHA